MQHLPLGAHARQIAFDVAAYVNQLSLVWLAFVAAPAFNQFLNISHYQSPF
jgi:hypothetical protein